MEEATDFIFLGSKITVDSDARHEIKRRLLLGRKAMTNLDSILKIRDITLTIKTFAGKTMVFPVVRFRCEYLCLVAQSCPTACNPMDSSPWNSPGKNTGVGCHFLLQGIFPIQGSNPGLQHCRHILYQLSHQGGPTCEYGGTGV